MYNPTRNSEIKLIETDDELYRSPLMTQSSSSQIGIKQNYGVASMRFSNSSTSTYGQLETSLKTDKIVDGKVGNYRTESLDSQEGRGRLIEQTCRNAITSSQNPVKLSFQNLSYTVTLPTTKLERLEKKMGKTKQFQVLKNISGYALPGQTLYIMGSSGAGKTSLMNALSSRINVQTGNKLEGSILLNDQEKMTQKLFGNYGAYVMQDDIIFEYFTVKEALTFAARLKLTISEEQQDMRVVKLIKDLSLQKCADTQIGGLMRKTISGGERKRTAIGVELITDPSVVLLDEPTSGLDSFMAKQIVKTLQKLAHQEGKTIIATIHQPSSEAFFYFDRLILMADGHIVYQGIANRSPRYFERIGFDIGKFMNPTDVFMRIVSVNYPKEEEDEQKLERLVSAYKSKCEPGVLKHMQEMSLLEFKPRTDNWSYPRFSTQMKLLISRQRTYLVRQPLISVAQIAIAIVQGVFSLAVFYKISGFTLVDFKNMIGSLFFLAANVFTGLVYGAIMSFQLERGVLLRELASKCYGLPAYFLTKNLFEIPLMVLFPLITLLIVYWGAPYGTYALDYYTFWKYYLVLFLVSQCAIGYGYMVSAACKNQVDSSLLSNAVNLPALFFGGLFANGSTMVTGCRWIQYLSPIWYGFQAMTLAEYQASGQAEHYVLQSLHFPLTYLECIYGLIALTIMTRICSLLILRLNVKYVA